MMENNHDPSLPIQAALVPDFNLGPWTVHPSLNRISKEGITEHLEPRMMHVLVSLAAVEGRVLGRRELLDHVWHDVVVGEEALTRAISRLRVLLGDPSQDSQVIETIRGVGYRLLCQAGPVMSEKKETATTDPLVKGSRARLGWLLAAAVVAAALVFLFFTLRGGTPEALAPAATLPFTTYPGYEAYPDFSPDGATIVFSRSQDDDFQGGIFLKQRDVENSRRLTTTEGSDYNPRFSPDGRQVAFVRREGSRRFLLTVPVLGGATRQLLEVSYPVFGMCWSPDGDRLVFACEDPQDGIPRLRNLHLDQLTCTPATQPDITTHTGDSWPAFSPDGKLLAFARCDHAGLRDVWLSAGDGGSEKQITQGLDNISGMSWLPDGRNLVVTASPDGKQRLYLVDSSDGSYSLLPMLVQGTLFHPVVSPSGQSVVFGAENRDYNLMKIVPGAPEAESSLAPFSISTWNEFHPAWSPDGLSVAFLSNRSGTEEVWQAQPDGSGLRKLTETVGLDLGPIHWSPSGSHIAVTAIDGNNSWVMVVDVSTGLTQNLSLGKQHEKVCGWSPDGQWINILRDIGSNWQLFQIEVGGAREKAGIFALNGHPQMVTNDEGIWFEHPESGGLWLAAGDGQTWEPVLTPEKMQGVRDWQPTAAGLVLLRRSSSGALEIVRLELDKDQETVLAQVDRNCVQMGVNEMDGRILTTALARVNADLFQADLPGQ